jgi:hypothetical protein
MMAYGLYALIGAIVGGGAVWLIYDIKARRVIEDLQKRLAAAETENLRIEPLERQIADVKAHNAELQDRNAELKDDVARKAEAIATLNAQLVEQANAARHKLSMLHKVQGRFCQALASLSETALNCDNDEFVRVMEVHVTSFEKTLLEDFGKWQSRDKTITREVCDLADSEQAATPLFAQDQTIEGLISIDAAAAEAGTELVQADESYTVVDRTRGAEESASAAIEEPPAMEAPVVADQEGDAIQDAGEVELIEPVDEEPVLSLADERSISETVAMIDADDENAAEAPYEARIELDVIEEEKVEISDTDTAAPQVDEASIRAALIEDQTNAAVADLERELEDELAMEFEGSEDDEELKLDFGREYSADEALGDSPAAEDTGEIRLADDEPAADQEAGTTLSLKFPIRELPAIADDPEIPLSHDAAEEALKKKAPNFESGQERKAV